MDMNEVSSDAARLTQAGHTFAEWFSMVWNYEYTQLIFLLIILSFIVYMSVGGWIIAFGRSGYNFIYDLFEGTRMRWNRERELDALFADMIYEGTLKLEEQDKISTDEKKLYLSRIGNLVPIKDLLPKNNNLTLKERLAAKWARITAPKDKQHPRELLAGMMRSKKATTA